MNKLIRLGIVAVLIASVILHYGQPNNNNIEKTSKITIEQKAYELYEDNNYLYIKTDKEYYKIINEEIIDFKAYNINSNENDEILVITKNDMDEVYGRDLTIYETEKKDGHIETKEIYRQDFSEIKPWKVDACNLDNDGKADIFIGVHKDTVFYKDVRNRPFFYSWDGENLNKKWLGSFFTGWDLVDIAFGDYYNLGYDIAAVLEKNNDSYRVGYYKFIGFGFENMNISKIYTNVRSIETVKEDGRDALALNFSGIKKNMKITYLPAK